MDDKKIAGWYWIEQGLSVALDIHKDKDSEVMFVHKKDSAINDLSTIDMNFYLKRTDDYDFYWREIKESKRDKKSESPNDVRILLLNGAIGHIHKRLNRLEMAIKGEG